MRIEGRYEAPIARPIPGFTPAREMGQMLGARAFGHLRQGRTEAALADLTLLHGIRRLMETQPGGAPMTWVGCMLSEFFSELQTCALGEGIQAHAWTAPQLAALQAQFQEVDLLALARNALLTDQAAMIESLNHPPPLIWRGMGLGNLNSEALCWLEPRGWVYQNMAAGARLTQRAIEVFSDRSQGLRPEKMPARWDAAETPYQFMVSPFLPDYVRMTRIMALGQTKVNQARIACALERYWLAFHEYPAWLATLAPTQFGQHPEGCDWRTTAGVSFGWQGRV